MYSPRWGVGKDLDFGFLLLHRGGHAARLYKITQGDESRPVFVIGEIQLNALV